MWIFIGLQVGCNDHPHKRTGQRSHGLIAGLLMGTLGDECCQKLNVANKLVAIANLQLWRSQNDGMTLLFVVSLLFRYVREDGAHGSAYSAYHRKLGGLRTECCDKLLVEVISEKYTLLAGKIPEERARRNFGLFSNLFNGCGRIALFHE